MIETNTFSSTSIAQTDYGLEDLVRAVSHHIIILLKHFCLDSDIDRKQYLEK